MLDTITNSLTDISTVPEKMVYVVIHALTSGIYALSVRSNTDVRFQYLRDWTIYIQSK